MNCRAARGFCDGQQRAPYIKQAAEELGLTEEVVKRGRLKGADTIGVRAAGPVENCRYFSTQWMCSLVMPRCRR